MSKKVMSILLVLALTAAAAGCGKKDAAPSAKPEVKTEQTAPEEKKEEKTEDKKEEAAPLQEEKEAAQAEKEILKVYTTEVKMTRSDDEKNRWDVVDTAYTTVTLSEEDAAKHPALAKALDEMNESSAVYYQDDVDRLFDMYMEYDRDSQFYTSYLDQSLRSVLRADNTVFAIKENYTNYEGGAHGYYAVTGKTFDVQTGKELSLTDVVKDQAAFRDEIRDRLIEKYPDTSFFEDPQVYFKNLDLGGSNAPAWTMDNEGITVYFEPYELAPYAEGILTVRFAFNEDAGLIVPKYLDAQENYAVKLETNEYVYADVDDDGKKEEIITYFGTNEDEYAYTWTVEVDGVRIEDPMYYYSNQAYLIRSNGKYFVYMFDTIENDYSVLTVIDLSHKKIVGDEWQYSNLGLYEKVKSNDDYTVTSRTQEVFLNPESFVLASRMNVLSTYTGTKTYYVSANGAPVSDDEQYDAGEIRYLIKPKKDVRCTRIDKDGKVLDRKSVISAGSLLRIIRTNGENTADVQASDFVLNKDEFPDLPYYATDEPLDLNKGEFYRIEFEVKDYEERIDGILVYDLFEGTMYAG